MGKYSEIAADYQNICDFVAEVLDEDREEEVKSFTLAAILKIWSSHPYYSPEYAAVIEEMTGEAYTPAQMLTALSCCAEPERNIIPPDFFMDMIQDDLIVGTADSRRLLDYYNDLLVALAFVNGDFTIEEANELCLILETLSLVCTEEGLPAQETDWDIYDRVTPIKTEGYRRSHPGEGEGRPRPKDREKPESPKKKDKPDAIIKIESDEGEIDIPINFDEPGGYVDLPPSVLKGSDGATAKAQEPEGAADQQTLNELLAELDSLVGLDSVKRDVLSLLNFIKVCRLREGRNLKVPVISYHLVFTGNPGTGKTTVARLVAQLYYHMGLLPKGQLVETDRSALVAGYLGQTAIKTQKVIQSALGGVLFIDEAYSLAGDKEDEYGKEAIETLLKAMEDHRKELVVIVAGYDELMHKFIDSNPGLRSRFSKYFHFPDYTGEELLRIFERFCKVNGYAINAEISELLLERFTQLYAERQEHFGNARTVRNIFEKAINGQANRLAAQENLSDDDLMTLAVEDFQEVFGGDSYGR